MSRCCWALSLLAIILPVEAAALRLRPRRSQPATSLNTRRRLAINTDTARKLDRSVSVDMTQSAGVDGSWLSPLTVTYQASRKLDFSLNFDAFERRATGAATQASSYWTLAASRTLTTVRGVEVAVMPLVTVLAQDASGLRAGATLLASSNLRGNSLGTSVTWTGATAPSPDNPAGLVEVGAGYGRKVGRFLLHGNLTAERGSSVPWLATVLKGVQWRLNSHWAVDFSGQHQGLGSTIEHRVLATVSWTSTR